MDTQTVKPKEFGQSFTISLWVAFKDTTKTSGNIIKETENNLLKLNFLQKTTDSNTKEYYFKCEPTSSTDFHVSDRITTISQIKVWHHVVCSQSIENISIEIWTDFVLGNRYS